MGKITNQKFYTKQTEITAAKVLFYRKYIGGYIIKMLMQFGVCIIADLFCGRGKNGSEKGSPLVLLEQAEKMLDSPVLQKNRKEPKIAVVFNDNDKANVENLENELSTHTLPKEIRIFGPYNKDFGMLLSEIKGELLDSDAPKFFFLDPYGYSEIQLDEIGEIMSFPRAEVLLFLPTFDAYRFAEGKSGLPKKTEDFLNQFTLKGVANYKDIHEFNYSIKERIMSALGIKFVRPILLDAGKRKHTLFFLTNHISGMLQMNKIFWQESTDGKGVAAVPVLSNYDTELFPESETSKEYNNFSRNLEGELKNRGSMTNVDIIEYVAAAGYSMKHARPVLQRLIKRSIIEVRYLDEKHKKSLYVSEDKWDDKLSEFRYVGSEQ